MIDANQHRELEDYKAELQHKLESYKNALQLNLENHKNTLTRGRLNDLALVIIRSLVLVNGAAVIAILTFIGNLWTESDGIEVAPQFSSGVAYTLKLFAVGVGLALVTAVFAFFGQAWANEARQHHTAHISKRLMKDWHGKDPVGAYICRSIGMVAAVLSTIVFFIAAFKAADIFGTSPP